MFAMKLHVASICFKCFKCFKGMLQVFHTDVVKVERMLQAHVLNVSSVIFRRCKCFHTYNASVLSGYVAYVYNGLKCF
jgi:hypothetical protein